MTLPLYSNNDLIILLPGEHILSTHLTLPAMRTSEKLKAIPYLLEEQLATDPDTVSVIVGDNNQDGTTNIFVFDTDFFQKEHTAWQASGLTPKYVLPDYLALSWTPDTWSVVFIDKIALIRIHYQTGFSIDSNNVFIFLKMLLAQNKHPTIINFWLNQSCIDGAEFETLNIATHFCDAVNQPYFDLSTIPINFLQGKYREQESISTIQKNWRKCIVVCAASIIFLLASNIVQWVYLKHQANQLKKNIAIVYHTLFPTAHAIIEPKFQAALLLKKYENVSHNMVFLNLYAIAGDVLSHYPDVVVQSISFDHHALQLILHIKNLNSVDALTKAFQDKKLKVIVRSDNGVFNFTISLV